jgi:hypothetical protein
MQILQSCVLDVHLSYTPKSVLAASFSGSAQSHPAGAPNLGDYLEVPRQLEDTMRSITTIVLPIIIAAGISGLMFTATLA